MGLARSGVAAARFLMGQGCRVRVTEATRAPQVRQAAEELEAAGAAVETGRHSRAFVKGSELLVVSPGVPRTAPPVLWAEERGIPVVGELELASWFCPGRIVAVTGSNGKSTVVTLLGEILRAAGRETAVCGNIGQPFIGELHRITARTTVVLEVSSFQLEGSLSFHPSVGCVLNITDNHLDRHGSMAAYQAAKARLFTFQQADEWAVLNADNPGSLGLKKSAPGRVTLFSRRREVPGAFGPVCPAGEMALQGRHHEENALAAACMAGLLGVERETITGVLRSFQGLPHRQEKVAQIRGVTFINDSKSTTVDSGIRAIEAAPGRVVLIAGGRDKGSDFRQLRPWSRKLKAAVVIGEDGPKIAASLQGRVPVVLRAGSLSEAVRAAFQLAARGECVLLSPMCTSFDMFRDFEDRGEKFSEAVRAIGGAG